MSIGSRVNAGLLSILAVGVVLTFAALQFVIQPRFDDIDRANAQLNQKRVIDAINAATDKMATATQDYSFWDETYNFIRGEGVDDYIKSNMQPELSAIQNLGVNALVFQLPDGSVKWGAAFDLESTQPIPGLVDEVAEFSRHHIAQRPGDFAERGLFKTSMGIVLTAIAPILKSDRTGEPFGKVISAKFLKVEDIQKLTGVDFELREPTSQDSTPMAGDKIETAIGPQNVTTRSGLLSLMNSPLAIIETVTPRNVHRTGATAILYALMMMVTAAIMATGLLWLFLRRIVVSRIELLSAHFKTAGETGAVRATVIDSAHDEIGHLATSFNHMAEQVNTLHRAVADNAYQAGISEWAAGTLHNVRNGLAPVTASTWQIEQLYAPALLRHIETAIAQYADASTSPARKVKLQEFLILSTAQLAASAKHSLEIIRTMNHATKSVVDMVSEFDRHATHQTTLSCVDVVPIIVAAASACKIGKSNVQFDLPEKPFELMTNSILFNQIIINVFINAIEAIENTGRPGLVQVKILPLDRFRRIIVKDNGEGIAPDVLAKAFKRGVTTRTKQTGGLGLHWCANAVKVLQGKISIVSSGPDQGTEIVIDLPASMVEMKDAA